MGSPGVKSSIKKKVGEKIAELERQLPLMDMDRQHAYLMYVACNGDVDRTAKLVNMDPVRLQRIVDEEGWKERMKPVLDLRKSTKPAEIERGINRALNFTQVHRARMVIERMIQKLFAMDDDELYEALCTVTTKKRGDAEWEDKRLNTRALSDLMAALEKAHMMSYYALNDIASDRTARAKLKPDDEQATAQEIHSAIAEAMTQVGASQSPRALVFDAELAEAEERTRQAELQTELAQAQGETK